MKRITSKIKAIIFDMDGTIIDTEAVWETALHTMLTQRGVPTEGRRDNDVFTRMIGREIHESLEMLREAFGIDAENAHLAAETLAHARELFKSDINFIKGFQTFHKKLADLQIPMSIATNCDQDSLHQLVDKMDFKKYFGECIYCVAHVDNKPKPDPALFLHAAKQMNVKPEECLVFEDSYWGFIAAKEAGMHCIAIRNLKNNEILHDHTDGGIDSYDDAEDFLEELADRLGIDVPEDV